MSTENPISENMERPQISYDGRPKPIAWIQLKNLLLLLPTLGVYRFWARTRLRRYFWSSLTLNGSRLEYTGRGWELFIGLILVLLVLIPLGIGFGFLFNFLLIDNPVLGYSLYAAFILLLVYLGYAGMYLKQRYILSRTRWRSIRFALKGSPWRFAWFGMGQFFLILITFSIYTPIATMNLLERIWQNSFFGDQPIKFNKITDGLMQRFLLIFASYFVGYIIFIIGVAVVTFASLGGDSFNTPLIVFAAIIFSIIWWGTFFWFLAIYQGRVVKNTIDSLSFHDASFGSEYNGSYMFKSFLIATLIVVPFMILCFGAASFYAYTTGDFAKISYLFSGYSDMGPFETMRLLAPFFIAGLLTYLAILFVAPVVVQHRMFRDIISTTTIQGHFDPSIIKQSDQALDGRGEGLATAMGV